MGFMLILIAITFFTFGILSKRNPTWGWRANEAWKVKGDSERSDAYIEDMWTFGYLPVSSAIGYQSSKNPSTLRAPRDFTF